MIEIITAFLLNFFLGDPVYSWHPARALEALIKRTEKVMRSLIKDAWTAGFLEALFIPFITFIAVWFVTEVAFQIHPILKGVFVVYFIFSTISLRKLSHEAKKIASALHNGKLEVARKNLASLIRQDIANLDQAEIVRLTVEALAKGFVSEILTPLFYTAVGSAPLVMAYEAVKTLSLQNSRFRKFASPAKKFNQIARWAPAGISWFLIGIAAYCLNRRGFEAWRVGLDKGVGSLSDDRISEAAFAGALGIELGGRSKIGYSMRSIEIKDIGRASQLLKMSAWVSLVFALLLNYLIVLVFH